MARKDVVAELRDKSAAGSGNSVDALNALRDKGNYAAEEQGNLGNSRISLDRKSMEKFTDKQVTEHIKTLFPDVDPGEDACDCFILVQELLVPTKVGSILKPFETTDADQAVTSFGMIKSIGPLCFKWDMTGEEFPGGASFAVGDIVRVPKFGGQEFIIDGVIFNIWKDRDVKTKIKNLRKIVAMYF